MEHRKVDSSKTISQQIKQHNQKAQKHRIHKEFDLFEIENDWRQRKWIVEDRHEYHIVTLLEMIVMHRLSSVKAQKCQPTKLYTWSIDEEVPEPWWEWSIDDVHLKDDLNKQ